MKHQFIKHVFMRFIAPFASEEPDNKEQKGGGERSTWRSEFINILFTFASTAFVFFWTLQPYKWVTNNIRKGWTRKVNLMSWVVWRARLNLLSLFSDSFSPQNFWSLNIIFLRQFFPTKFFQDLINFNCKDIIWEFDHFLYFSCWFFYNWIILFLCALPQSAFDFLLSV